MKFFVPEWDDKVDANYDFENDEFSGRPNERESNYIWQIFEKGNFPIDGVLISRAKAERKNNEYEELRKNGFYSFMNLPEELDTISDCGAWDYKDEDEPRYDTKDMLEFYYDINVDIGVSIDHLIMKKEQEDKKYRFDITIKNAKDMFDVWKNKDKYYRNLRLMGAIQGWDPDSYAKSGRKLMDHGYRYIGVGGLANSHTEQAKKVIRKIGIEVKNFERKNNEKIDVHLFGFGRTSLFDLAAKAGVSSFDTASMLRQAWGSIGDNYQTPGQNYGGIRVRYATNSSSSVDKKIKKRAKKKSKEDLTKLEKLSLEDEEKFEKKLKEKEQNLLKKLRRYDKGKVDYEEIFSSLIEYEKISGDLDKNRAEYEKTLKNRPWEDCDCPICEELGIEVCIFRGNNRNRRRGFHNTYVFYKELRKEIPKILVFTNCTSSKIKSPDYMPAYQRYSKSTPFKSWWNQVYDLPIVELGIFSAKFGLIPWWKKIPNYDYKMQEEDVEKYVKELESQLVRYDKIYFHGLGLYRKIVDEVRDNIDVSVELFPKKELTERSLDAIEYPKQAKYLRKEILEYLGISENFVPNEYKQKKLDDIER